MTPDQITIFAIIGAALVLFIWGRWRFGVVTMVALFAWVLTGLVGTESAFDGFSHLPMSFASILGLLPVDEAYDSVDWPVVVLLGTMIPVGGALGSTGATELIADTITSLAGDVSFYLLMAVGASCAFLTLIGHQNNTLVMGPGGYQFSDYWRMGLPLEILLVAIGVPLMPVVWPF